MKYDFADGERKNKTEPTNQIQKRKGQKELQ